MSLNSLGSSSISGQVIKGWTCFWVYICGILCYKIQLIFSKKAMEVECEYQKIQGRCYVSYTSEHLSSQVSKKTKAILKSLLLGFILRNQTWSPSLSKQNQTSTETDCLRCSSAELSPKDQVTIWQNCLQRHGFHTYHLQFHQKFSGFTAKSCVFNFVYLSLQFGLLLRRTSLRPL